jgi:hypothetical protein
MIEIVLPPIPPAGRIETAGSTPGGLSCAGCLLTFSDPYALLRISLAVVTLIMLMSEGWSRSYRQRDAVGHLIALATVIVLCVAIANHRWSKVPHHQNRARVLPVPPVGAFELFQTVPLLNRPGGF